VRTITYSDKTAHWNRINHLLGARMLPSSEDSDKISVNPEEQGLR
jgi:hypothetical protein